MQAAAAQRDIQLRSLAQERHEADEASARHHAAAMHSMQQAHELEQVSTPASLHAAANWHPQTLKSLMDRCVDISSAARSASQDI